MLFTSPAFLALLAVALALYYAPPLAAYQRQVILAASCVFYGAHQPALLALLFASIGVNVLASYAVAHGPPRARRPAAIAGVALNLAALAFERWLRDALARPAS